MKQHYTTKTNGRRSFSPRWLLLLLVSLLAYPAMASHFRFGNITWQRVPGSPMKIQFTVTQAWRGNSLTVTSGGSTSGLPNIGATVSTGTTLLTGGGGNAAINLTVTSVNPAPNIADSWIYGTFSYTATYTTTGTRTASFGTCCRIASPLVNNANGDFVVSSIVTVGNSNDCPVSSIPPIINLPIGQAAATYQIPANDPNGDSLTYSLTAPGSFGANTTQPSGLSVSSTGKLSFNTLASAGRSIGQLYSTNITIRDSKGATTQLDVLIRISAPSTPPQFDYTTGQTPGNGITYQIQPGQTVAFNVKAFDTDPGDTVNLNAVGVPVGASFSAGNGNPVTRSFSWTPTSAQLGTRQINFVATDKNSIQTNTIVNIVVSLKPQFTAPTPGNGSAFCVVPGDTITARFRAIDPDPNDSVSLSIVSGLRSGMSFNPLPTGFENPVVTDLSWPTQASDWGIHRLVVKATDSYNESVSDTVNWIVDHAPVVTSTPTNSALTTGQPFSYTITATDADAPYGDYVRIAHTHLPSWMTIIDNLNNTFTLSGTPGTADTGEAHVSIELEDSVGHKLGTHCGSTHLDFEIEVLPCAVSLSGATTNVSCFGGNDGAIDVSVANAAAPISYNWSNAATSEDLGGLMAGGYRLLVTDAYGCQASDSFTLVVVDSLKPVITTNGDQSVSNTTGQCGAIVSATAGATDNCSVGAPTGIRSDALPLSAAYPVGVTTITWNVSDNNGNAATAVSQTITVTDSEVPAITAPASVSVNTDAGQCSAANVSLGFPITSDNCGIATTTNDAPATFPTGTTTVTWTVRDIHGNLATATQSVIVTDNQFPTITAPAALSPSTDPGLCSASGVTLGTPVTADNCGVGSVTNDAPAVFPKGTTTVTWTVRDNSGNLATATQTVTVSDNEIPTITAPAAVNAVADNGQCYATIAAIGSPAFADNCPGSSVTSNAPANNQYPVGTTTVTWTVTDAANHTATATQTITVTDTQNPAITAPANLTVGTDANLCSASGVTLGTPVTADNCGVASVTNNAPASFPKGTTTVTWIARDVNNNTMTATQTVTVEDRQNPTITAPANVATTTSADGTGNCSTKASLGNPVAADNCGAVTVIAKIGGNLVNTSTYSFPTGVTTVIWTATDGSGNTASASQTVTVTDNEKPAIVCPANVAQCYSAAGNTLSLSLNASDNCAIASTSYVISGATIGSGTGTSLSRGFNTGVSTITWTVTDGSNNSSSCSTTVTIRPLPIVTISASGADDFCNATTLTAAIAPAGTASYAWTYNNAAFATTQSVKLKLSNADGNYSVVATDAFGCSSAPAVYSYQKQTLISSYVLIGMKEVDLAQYNDVIGGSVGVTSSHGEAEFDKYCTVASPGAFVKAKDIDTKSPVNIPTKIYSQAIVTMPTMYLNASNPSSLSNYVMTTNGTVAGNKKDLTINSNKTVTVTGNVFRRIRICHGAEVTFTASDISLEALIVDKDVTVHFAGTTKLRVSDEVNVDKGVSINPEANRVTFYVKEPASGSYNCFGNWNSWHSWLGGSSEKFVVDGKGTNIVANVYMPNGKLRVHGNGWNCSWGSSEACNMMGLFIAEEIEGDGKNINWYSYDCAAPASFRRAAPVAAIEEAAGYQVMMYPNPTNGQFTLQFGNNAEPAEVRITDIQGRLIATREVKLSEMPSASFNLSNQTPGIYLVEIRQGAQSVRNRIVLR